MAFDCLDLATGRIRHWPRPGGWYDQDSDELEGVKIAWRTWKWFTDEKSRKWADAVTFIQFLSSV